VALSRRAALRRRRSMAGRHSIQIAGAVGGLTATTAEDAPAAAPLVSVRGIVNRHFPHRLIVEMDFVWRHGGCWPGDRQETRHP
jgi:hypothetical protein